VALYVIEGNDFRMGIPGDRRKERFKDRLAPSYSGTLLKSLEINNERFDIKLMKKNR
jgi:hypothetical protein